MTYIENDLQLFPNHNLKIIKFDDPKGHGLSGYNMKAIDYIIEYSDKYVFLEIKDPDNPNARTTQIEEFKNELMSENFRTDMAKKYRDTFIYRWAQDKTDKPIHYYVLVCLKELRVEQYIVLTDNLKKHLPQHYPEKWKRPLAHKCAALPLKEWNKLFPDCIIRRRSMMEGN